MDIDSVFSSLAYFLLREKELFVLFIVSFVLICFSLLINVLLSLPLDANGCFVIVKFSGLIHLFLDNSKAVLLLWIIMSPPFRVGRHIVFPRSSVHLSVCHKSCPLFNLKTT